MLYSIYICCLIYEAENSVIQVSDRSRYAQSHKQPHHSSNSRTTSMSDSEASTQFPSSLAIEQGLRATVARIFRSANHDNLTIKRVRKAAEEELELPDDFFKNSKDWKDRSKDLITAEVVCRVDSSHSCGLIINANAGFVGEVGS